MKRLYALLAGFAIVFSVFPARAYSSDCRAYFRPFEQKFSIPDNLLYAIALTESGKTDRNTGRYIPWPWTVHAEGRGQFFSSKEEAVRAVERLQARGVENIDIGCMQINLQYHGQAFRSLSQMFDPVYNVAYASRFIAGHYQETRHWGKAVAYYHSRTPSRGKRYVSQVLKNWRTLAQGDDRVPAGAQLSALAGGMEALRSPSAKRRANNSHMIVFNAAAPAPSSPQVN